MSALPVTRKKIGELRNEGTCAMNTFFAVGDLNADGMPDVVVAGRNGAIAWFENPGAAGEWRRHPIGEARGQECGGVVYDLTGSGYPDIITGGDYTSDALSWWENPGPAGGDWVRRVVLTTGSPQFHDVAVGVVTPDGKPSLLFTNQKAGTLGRVPIPEDPRVSPWTGLEIIATGKVEDGVPEEGLAVADLDGDGRNEVIAGNFWYKHGNAGWEGYRFARGYLTPLIAVGDLDGDGRMEIVLSEGDPCIYGRPEGGRLAWFKPGADIREPWAEHVLAEGLLDAHSLQLGDLCGNGRLDIFTGEIGVAESYTERPPRLLVFENDGRGGFASHVIDRGIGVHQARLADLRGKGVPDIVSRPLHGEERWNIYAWYNERGGRVE